MHGTIICVTGPPAAGKSTLARELARAESTNIFRLREAAAAQAVTDAVVRNEIETSRDALGWLGDPIVERLVRAARLGRPGAPRVIEGFPGTARQVAMLISALPPRQPLVVLELVAADHVLAARAAARRVCVVCDSHRPEVGSTCARCGGPVTTRPDDSPWQLAARIARYRANAPAVAASFRRRRVPYVLVSADAPRAAVAARAAEALHSTTLDRGPRSTG